MNKTNIHPFRALLWLRSDNGAIPILPIRGFSYLLILLAILAAVCVMADRYLAHFAAGGKIEVDAWRTDNSLINRENYKKIQNTSLNPIFRSSGMVPPVSQSGRQRLLVIGDSFIWGDGLSNLNMTWWKQLQWELERRGYHNIDVVAAGTNGASTQDQYGWLTTGRLLETTKSDAVVIGYVTNDPDMKTLSGNSLVRQMAARSETNNLKSSAVGRLLPNLSFQLAANASKKQQQSLDHKTGYPYSLWELKILEGENFTRYKALLWQLSEFIKDAGIPIFFVTTPNAPHADHFEKRYRPIRTAFAAAEIELYDLLPQLLRCCNDANGSLIWGTNPANGHPGSRMTHFYATQVADILESRYPNVLGPRTKTPASFLPNINDWLPSSLAPKPVGPAAWEFTLPDVQQDFLRMPVDEPHVALNFERPVSIRKISLTTETPTHFKMWALLLDDKENFELRGYVQVGSAEGAQAAIDLPAGLSNKRITSLRITAEPLSGHGSSSPDKSTQTIRVDIGFNSPAVRL